MVYFIFSDAFFLLTRQFLCIKKLSFLRQKSGFYTHKGGGMGNLKCCSIVATIAFIGFSADLFSVKLNHPQPDNILPYKSGQLLVKTIEGAPSDALDAIANSLGAVPVKEYELVPGLALYEYD